MLWIFFALGSHVMWAGENILTKYAVDKKIKNPYIFLILFSILEGVVLLLWPFTNFSWPSWSVFGFLLLAAFLYFFGGFPYVKAMQSEEVSRINIFWGLIPIISLLFGYVLGERINLQETIALAILVFGTVLAGFHFEKGGKWKFSKAFWLMLLACVAFSGYGVVMHQVYKSISFLSGFILICFFELVYSLIVLFVHRRWYKEFKTVVTTIDKKFSLVLFCTVVFALTGGFLNQLALKLQQASLVFSLEGFQIIFVFFVAILLSIYFPRFLHEEIDKKNIILKLAALVFMVVGIVVLNM